MKIYRLVSLILIHRKFIRAKLKTPEYVDVNKQRFNGQCGFVKSKLRAGNLIFFPKQNKNKTKEMAGCSFLS